MSTPERMPHEKVVYIMLTLIGAVAGTTPTVELEWLRHELEAWLFSGTFNDHDGAASLVRAFSDLVAIELKWDDVKASQYDDFDAELRRLLDGGGNGAGTG